MHVIKLDSHIADIIESDYEKTASIIKLIEDNHGKFDEEIGKLYLECNKTIG